MCAGARPGGLAGRAVAVPLREAAAGSGAENPYAHPRMIENQCDLRARAHVDRGSGAMKVEVTGCEAAEVEADVLALAAGGLRVRELDRLFEGRLARAAAVADPVAVVPVARELRARHVALVAL